MTLSPPLPFVFRGAAWYGLGVAARDPSVAPRAGAGQADPEEFLDWLGSRVVKVYLIREHGQWYAVVEDFGLSGVGKSQNAALSDVTGLVEAYLRSYYEEGRPYHEALRQPKKSVWTLAARVVARLRRARQTRRLALPSALRPAH